MRLSFTPADTLVVKAFPHINFYSPDANLAPSHVHVTCVSPTSAKIEWSPGNSSFSHEILVNGTLHRTIRAGIFQHTITNLEPDHMYKVHVRAKSGKKVVDEGNELDIVVDFLTAETEFRTEPGGKKESKFCWQSKKTKI